MKDANLVYFKLKKSLLSFPKTMAPTKFNENGLVSLELKRHSKKICTLCDAIFLDRGYLWKLFLKTEGALGGFLGNFGD